MLRWLALIIVVLALGVAGVFAAVNSGLFKPRIEQELSTRLGSKVKLGAIQIQPRWPLTLSVDNGDIEHLFGHAQFRRLTIEIASFTQPYDLKIILQQPKIKAKPVVPTAAKSPEPVASVAGKGGVGPQIKLDLRIEAGEVTYEKYSLTALDLSFSQKILLRTPAKFRFKAYVATPYLPGALPLSIESDSLTLTDESVKSESTRTFIGGMSAVLQGGSLLKDQRHRWSISVNAPDLAKLPQPPMALPAKSWKGAVVAKAEITKENASKSWGAEGTVSAKGVGANLIWNQAGRLIEGPFNADADLKFVFAEGKLALPTVTAKVDMTSARVQWAGLLDKPAGVTLKSELMASGTTDVLRIQKLTGELAQIQVSVAGESQLAEPFPAKLSMAMQPVNLKGLEAFILPLRKSPVQGTAELKADIHGPLIDPMAAHILVQQFKIKDLSADVDFGAPGPNAPAGAIQLRGPLRATIDAKGEWKDKAVKSAQGAGQVELGRAALVAGPFRKEAAQALSAGFAIKNVGEALLIDRLDVSGFFGSLKGRGQIMNMAAPKVDFTLEMAPLDLAELRMALPEFRELVPKGSVRGSLTTKGQVDTKLLWQNWPLVVTGNLAINIPEYKLATETAAQSTPPAPSVGKQPEATGFLPDGALTQKLRVTLKADLGLLLKERLTVKGLSLSGAIAEGHFRGAANIAQIFSGSVAATGLDVPLLEVNPVLAGKVNWNQIVIQDALEFAKPEHKNLATGKTAGTAEFATHMPSHPEFLKSMKVKGETNLEPVTLNTVKIGQIINDMLAKVPAIKVPAAKTTPLTGVIKASFDMAQGVLQLPSMVAKDVDNSELQLKGNVVLASMQGDLVGNFHWAQPTLKGCILDGNADSQGRLQIPLAIKGDLMNPGVSLISDLAGKLVGKSLECERKKLVERLKKEGSEKVGKELNKALKNLIGN